MSSASDIQYWYYCKCAYNLGNKKCNTYYTCKLGHIFKHIFITMSIYGFIMCGIIYIYMGYETHTYIHIYKYIKIKYNIAGVSFRYMEHIEL